MSKGSTHQVLRISYIWRDEVMCNLVLTRPQTITLGTTKKAKILTADVGLPDNFAILRPSPGGYTLCLGPNMGGHVRSNNRMAEVSQLLASGIGPQGFQETTIAPGDHGVVHLDNSGNFKLFFHFGEKTPPLPKGPLVRDPELLLPAFGFASVFVGFFLVYALWFFNYTGPSFLWPGRRELVADYLLSRPPPAQPEEESNSRAGEKDGAKDEKPASTKDDVGKAGGEGKKDRKREKDPDKGEPNKPLPEKIQTGLLSKRNRETLAKVRDRAGFDKKLGNALSRLTGEPNDGSLVGTGTGKGTGVGVNEGTGTVTKGTGKGPGGGGSALADVVTQGRLNTGGKRTARGTPGGNSVKEQQVKVTTGAPSGTFGGLTPEQILKVVRTRQRGIQACYSRELQRDKGLGGKIQVTWKISGSGQVSRVQIRRSTLKNHRVEDCVTRQINSMKFPSPKGGGTATVNFPFIFGQQ